MKLDTSLVGKTYPPIFFDVEKQRLRAFAKATGQTDPAYFDEAAAIACGYPSLLAPPTFLVVVAMEQDDPTRFMKDLDMDMSRVLHASQDFDYYSSVFAGDRLEMSSTIDNIFEKKGGALQFCAMKYSYKNQDGILVAASTFTVVVR